ncbi:MAG: acyl-CoA dehydrogenase family protein [Proteobacteria bacterium]|nr:acyl-CoA dehydrogenase family protein [Pseudomonadota bacterium]
MDQNAPDGQAKTIPTREELLDRARALVPTLKERAAECEALRRLPDSTLQDFHAAGFYNISKPKRYGGYELGYDVICEVVMELAKGCGSSAWNCGVVTEHNVAVANSTAELLDEIWGENSNALIASGNNPTAVAVPVDGGYRLSTQISFSSACDHCDWWMLGANLEGTDKRIGVTVAKKDVEIIDNWNVVGLAGTGSKDVRINDAFIPYHRVRGADHSPPFGGVDAGVENPANYLITQLTTKPYALTSVAVGLALGTIDDFTAEMKERASRFGARIAEFQSLQLRIAESAAEAHAAKTVLLSNMRESPDLVSDGSELPFDISRRNWRDMAWAAKTSAASVARLMYAAGANGLFLANHIQRNFRDVHAVGAQILQSWDVAGTEYGRMQLGLEPGWPVTVIQ